MRICWDNLKKLEYRPDRGEWQDKWKNYYVYKDSCKNCSEPFLMQKGSKGDFCNYSCVRDGKNNFDIKWKLTDETKSKMKIVALKRKKHPSYKGGVKKKNIPLHDTYSHQISFCEQVRRNKKDSNILEVKCAYCGKWYIPKQTDIRNRIQSLNGEMAGESRFYCSTKCKQECPIYRKIKYQVGHPDSNKSQHSREVQPELRQMCFERDDYICQKCGLHQNKLDVGLHCHHIEGIRWEPLESSDLDKVITFCKNCHIEVHKQPDCGYHDMRCSR